MRIAMVSEHASPLAVIGGVDAGGQNVHVAELAAAMARAGHRVTVYTRRDDPELPRTAALCDDVEVVHVDAGPARRVPKDELLPYMRGFAAELVEDFARTRPEVVHSHFWMSGVAAIDAARAWEDRTAERVPVLHTYHALGVVKQRHQGAQDTSPPERLGLEERIGLEADGIVATCSDEAFELRTLGVAGTRISVVPCGVDLRRFTTRGRAEARRHRRLLSVGRLVPRKGHDLAIRALARLHERGLDDVELQIIGGDDTDAAEHHRLRELAAALGVEHRVVLRGRLAQNELPAVLRSADAVICAPWYEPFGIVPLEAMACGAPVVSATVGGLIDTVVDGVTGLHVPPRDDEAIADAAQRILADDALRLALGDGGRRRARRRYGWDRVAADTLNVYQTVLAGGRQRHPLRTAGGAR